MSQKKAKFGHMVPPSKSSNNEELGGKIGIKVPPSQSLEGLPLFEAEKEREINGVGMGVLTNGMPYLTGAGLAKLCGVDTKAIRTISSNWQKEKLKPRGKIIAQVLEDSGYKDEALYIQVHTKGNQHINAYPDIVCMAFLEYYAFDAKKDDAIANYRSLARKTLKDFIYSSVGYDPKKSQTDSWKYYYDRVSILQNKVPDDYFSIFNEIAGMTLDLIINRFTVSDKNIPDISVGLVWASYWKKEDLASKHGDRIEYDHHYPDYYQQSYSNPQKAFAYPVSALGEFRKWFKNKYLISKFPKYILKKACILEGGKEEAEKLIEIFNNMQLLPKSK